MATFKDGRPTVAQAEVAAPREPMRKHPQVWRGIAHVLTSELELFEKAVAESLSERLSFELVETVGNETVVRCEYVVCGANKTDVRDFFKHSNLVLISLKREKGRVPMLCTCPRTNVSCTVEDSTALVDAYLASK